MRKWITAGLLLVALAGCGSAESGDDVASAGGKNSPTGSPAPRAGDDGGLEYAKCMRDNGIDMPDPEPGKLPPVLHGPPGSTEDKALTACKQFLPNGGEPEEISQEDLEKVREYTKCMRDNGIDMPDPGPDGSTTGGAVSGEEAEKLAAADKICQSKLPGEK